MNQYIMLSDEIYWTTKFDTHVFLNDLMLSLCSKYGNKLLDEMIYWTKDCDDA